MVEKLCKADAIWFGSLIACFGGNLWCPYEFTLSVHSLVIEEYVYKAQISHTYRLPCLTDNKLLILPTWVYSLSFF